jgi:PilZ domain-containing protein
MPSDVTIVVADPSRLAAIRDGASLPGRMMPFSSAGLASAIASIRAYRPRLIAVDALFAETPPGAAFIEQVEPLTRNGGSIMLLVENDGKWVTTPNSAARALTQSQPATALASDSRIVTPSAQAVAAVSNAAAAAHAEAVNTRRAPRFLVRDQLDVIVESGHANLIDLSVLGAQIVSLPVLRPRQKIKVDLTDTDDMLSVIAEVAWSLFEKPQVKIEPYYRVGLEFTGAAQQALEKYRQRHCADNPISQRGK